MMAKPTSFINWDIIIVYNIIKGLKTDVFDNGFRKWVTKRKRLFKSFKQHFSVSSGLNIHLQSINAS